ncbi:OsmC family protein [Bdellovibrio sp. HCB337]|uniref:OsmC family protein n=1 Tax=Bdellovibrio sp. HCB337 TaxID=3394358 RepID=UPI0039A41AD4
MKHEIQVGSHHLIADVSTAEGGEDLGPSPHDYLAVALASCTAITLRMYAQRKSWPLKSADTLVNVDHQKEVTKFDRRINLIGDLDDEQRKRLLDIANHCPIHKALSGKIEITTSLA